MKEENQQHRIIGVTTRRQKHAPSKIPETGKLDRLIKTGMSRQMESLGFPNFIIA